MVQQVLVLILFGGALGYLGKLLYQNFKSRSAGCASGCGKCGVSNLDVDKIEAQIRKSSGRQVSK